MEKSFDFDSIKLDVEQAIKKTTIELIFEATNKDESTIGPSELIYKADGIIIPQNLLVVDNWNKNKATKNGYFTCTFCYQDEQYNNTSSNVTLTTQNHFAWPLEHFFANYLTPNLNDRELKAS